MTEHRIIATNPTKSRVNVLGSVRDIIAHRRMKVPNDCLVFLQEREDGQWCDVREL